MWISKFNIRNIRSIQASDFEFSKGINIIIGPNNSGKSTILRSLISFQDQTLNSGESLLRKKEYKGIISGQFENSKNKLMGKVSNVSNSELIIYPESDTNCIANIIHKTNKRLLKYSPENSIPHRIEQIPDHLRDAIEHNGFPNEEPDNPIYPFFSNRMHISAYQNFDEENSYKVSGDLRFLIPRVEKLNNSAHPFHQKFMEMCKEIIGFGVGIIPNKNFPKLGIYVGTTETIPLETMGEGVAMILGILTTLLVDDDKIFLIEEIEHDIHPKALKKILEFIIEKSETNQFIISTHSNIVLKYLGSQNNSKIFKTSMEEELSPGSNPITNSVEISNTPEERIKLLIELGYDVFDFELWKGYLILEESTAELIIREFLIPQYAPKLQFKLKTIEAKGIGNLSSTFNDFLRLFIFIHTSGLYKGKAWVIVDGDKPGQKIIEELRAKFKSWPSSHFQCFQQTQFELYYPKQFSAEVEVIFKMPNGLEKMKGKGKLAEKVLSWSMANIEDARMEFSKNAKDVIDALKIIENEINT